MTRSSASLQLLQASTFIAECGLNAESEHGNAEDHFAIAVREHSDTRPDEGVNDSHTRGRPNLSAVVLICSNDTRTSHVLDLFAFYLTPNDRINN